MKRQVLTTIEEVREFFKDFNTDLFAFDTETTALEYDKLLIRGASFCDGNKACYVDLEQPLEFGKYILTIRDLEPIFKKAKMIVGHNLVFDLKVLYKGSIIIPEGTQLYCTMVADHLLDENRSHALKSLAKELLGKEVVTYAEASRASHDVFQQYAIDDAVYTWELMQWQRPKLIEMDLVPLFTEVEMQFQRVLLDIEVNGVLVDWEQVSKTTKLLVGEIEKLQVEMLEMVDAPYEMQMDLFGNSRIITEVNLNSSQQLANILFKLLELTPVEYTPSGAISVGGRTIKALKDKHPFVALLEKYKVAQKLLNAFFTPMPVYRDSDDRIRPHFNDCGTKTGRLSCSKPNLQQLPKVNKAFPIDTRSCFIVPEGKTMLTCDYSGQELRVLTQLTREPVLIDTFNKGKDMHLSTANDFFELGIIEEELFSTHPKCKEHKEKYYNERNKAKVINFGMAYGKGAYGFAKDFNISEDEAQKILDKYFAALPKVKEAIDSCHKSVRDNGFVVSMAMRRRRFKPKEGTNFYPNAAFRQSFNFLIQGFSADMIRKAMIEVRKLGRSNPEWRLKTIATVHDESVYEVKTEYVEEASKAIKEAFEKAVSFCIPVVADVGIGANYSQAK